MSGILTKEEAEIKDVYDFINELNQALRHKYKNKDKLLLAAHKEIEKRMMDPKLIPNFLNFKLFRGACAELIMTYILEKIREKRSVYVRENITLRNNQGTTQIDHLILTNKSAVVIEVKSLGGDLYIDDGIINQKINIKGKVESRELLPWSQNLLHINSLKEYLKLPTLYCHNVVFLYGNYNIKNYFPKQYQYLLTFETAIKNLNKLLNFVPSFYPDVQTMINAVKILEKLSYEDSLEHIRLCQKNKQ